jgi:hypothetical protein
MGVMVVDKDSGSDAKINIRLDSIPVGQWDGWLKAFPRDERSSGRRDAPQSEDPRPPAPTPPVTYADADTPF